MFREFNVKFEDVEMLGGADNLLEGTEITKVIVRGDNNKMSSLDSMLKNCNELDTIDGELDLNGVSDIDNLLEGTELVKSINLKNINNENISANNSFPHVDQINIGGELYNKKAMQNVIASKDWTFDNINYQGTVSDNIVTKEVNIVDDNKATIQDTLEQKAKGIEIIGQTYENLVVGSGEVTLLDELTLEGIDGSPNEFTPHIEQPVCVEAIEGETYQNLVNGKGEYNLTNKATFIPLGLQPNKDYTLQLDTIGKNDKLITVNLGGTEATIQPINDTSKHHKVVVRTPSTLTTDKLELSGEGVVVNDVMLFEGGGNEIKQEVEYVEGIQNIGELQEDGTYKIDILSSNTKYLKPITAGLVSWINYDDYVTSSKVIVDRVTGQVISCECDSNGIYKSGGIQLDSLSTIKTIECNGTHKDTTNANGTSMSGCTIFYGSANGVTVSSRCRTNDKYSYCDNITGYNFFYNTPYQSGWQNDLNAEGKMNEYLNGGLFYCSLKADVEDIPLNFGYFPHGGATLNRYKDILVYDRGLTAEEVEHNKKYHRLRSVAKEDLHTSKQYILLPQPLNRIGDIKDKFYWDDDKGHYCIEQNVDSITLTGLESFEVHSRIGEVTKFKLLLNSSNTKRWGRCISDKFSYNRKILNSQNPFEICCGDNAREVFLFTVPSNILTSDDTEGFKEWLSNNNVKVVYETSSSNIIDLPHLNKKYSLDTYMPTTYLQCVDTAIQPSRMYLETDTVRYKPSGLETNTDYTVQFECLEKSDKKLKLNLGGAEKEVDAIVGLNHVSITTPSEIDVNTYKDRLFLSGVGNKVDNVMVVKGEMNQYPGYFNGVQSVGELQGDGTYKIDIKTNEEFKVSVQTNNPLTKGDKLYWNKSNKRYEIDRGGSVEVPTVSGDIIDLPRLYQREDTHFSASTGNIKPSKIKLDYNDLD